MKVKRRTDQRYELIVDERELEAFQSGMRETLECLDDWEFSTRTGLERDEMVELLRDLRIRWTEADET